MVAAPVTLKELPLLARLRRISLLYEGSIMNRERMEIIDTCNASNTASCAEDRKQHVDQAIALVAHSKFARLVHDGARSIEAMRREAFAAMVEAEHAAFSALLMESLLEREAVLREDDRLEWQRFVGFAESNEPQWRRAASQAAEMRAEKERQRKISELTQALLSLDEDARQDKYTWFEEARDWLTAISFMEEDDRQAATRRAQRRVADAASAAAIAAAAMSQRSATSAPPSQYATSQYYGAPSSQQPQQQQQWQSYPQPYGSSSGGAPVYGSAPNNYPAAPSGYPSYGSSNPNVATTPYASNGYGQYDPNRTANYNVVNGVNHGNNYGMATNRPSGQQPYVGTTSPQPSSAYNQYTAPPANIFYGRR